MLKLVIYDALLLYKEFSFFFSCKWQKGIVFLKRTLCLIKHDDKSWEATVFWDLVLAYQAVHYR